LIVRPLDEGDATALLELHRVNREFLAPFEPERPESFWTLDEQRARIADADRQRWLILDGGEPAGVISFSDVVRGPLQRAIVSYWVDGARNGRGLATRALAAVIPIAFGELGLHRLEAGTLPDNLRSQRVLEKNGFVRFGLARNYLLIAGEWRDHVLYELNAG
jgi:ribosomal-protein-alanine N-acetyltransferase